MLQSDENQAVTEPREEGGKDREMEGAEALEVA